MDPEPAQRLGALEPCIEDLLAAPTRAARERALLQAALRLGSDGAWLWRRTAQGWRPVAASGAGPARPAPDLVRAVLEGRLPESLLGGSVRAVVEERLAIVLFPCPSDSPSAGEALEEALQALLALTHALGTADAADPDASHGPTRAG